MPRSKLPFSDSNVEILAVQEKYLAAKVMAQERKKREKEEAEQKWGEKKMKEREAVEVAAAEEEKKKRKATEAKKAKKVSDSKAAGKQKMIEESNLDNVEIVDKASLKRKRGKINTTVKYGGGNLCRRCKHLNIKCIAK